MALGGKAVGLCGIDGSMIQAHQKEEALGFVGVIDRVDISLIETTIAAGYIPVIATVGVDDSGQVYNINADTAASYIAGALQAETMIAMTNIDGVLTDVTDSDSLLSVLTVQEVQSMKEKGIIAGGMIPKVDSCVDALQAGAKKVFIINGEIPHAILIELLTDEGLGTMFIKE